MKSRFLYTLLCLSNALFAFGATECTGNSVSKTETLDNIKTEMGWKIALPCLNDRLTVTVKGIKNEKEALQYALKFRDSCGNRIKIFPVYSNGAITFKLYNVKTNYLANAGGNLTLNLTHADGKAYSILVAAPPNTGTPPVVNVAPAGSNTPCRPTYRFFKLEDLPADETTEVTINIPCRKSQLTLAVLNVKDSDIYKLAYLIGEKQHSIDATVNADTLTFRFFTDSLNYLENMDTATRVELVRGGTPVRIIRLKIPPKATQQVTKEEPATETDKQPAKEEQPKQDKPVQKQAPAPAEPK